MNYAWRKGGDKFGEIYRMSNLFPIQLVSLLKKLLLAGALTLYSAQPLLNDYYQVSDCKSRVLEFMYNLPGKSMQHLIPYCEKLEKRAFMRFSSQTAQFILSENNMDQLQRPASTETIRPFNAGIFRVMIGNLNGD
jgi:hypothetical protein